jgi:hypothetical protein
MGCAAASLVTLNGGPKDGETLVVQDGVNDLQFIVRTNPHYDAPITKAILAIYKRNMKAHAIGGREFDFCGYTKGGSL